MDERAYPADFAAFVRYQPAIRRTIPARYPLPGPLTLRQFADFRETIGFGDRVDWIEAGELPRTPSPSQALL